MTSAIAPPRYILCLVVAVVMFGCRSSTPFAPVQVVDLIREMDHADKRPAGGFSIAMQQVGRVARPAISAAAQPADGGASSSQARRLSRVCGARRRTSRRDCRTGSPSARRQRSSHLRRRYGADPFARSAYVGRLQRRPVRLRGLEVEPILSSGSDHVAGCSGGRRDRAGTRDRPVGNARNRYRYGIRTRVRRTASAAALNPGIPR